ncbi:MAG: YjbQ family protein [Deltaproteobacteria bacterium]|nr:YjbQ family protein [Deltaproteobacteria bacterium]MBW1923185.1 YjbQ family protein [Deltaproteobacteria bacterium]MBW1948270.1 YjbQ family protein [Deltaproteobacteria bacterium]MBW2006767.1 YjbQ family protein [Deltaproteobacteria bacterium]MBW2101507.1 YjbQ family protein [Deltaproteobacteria bacterium]
MKIHVETLAVNTTRRCDVVDLTSDVDRRVRDTGILNGVVTLFVPGSTGALTTIEYETGVINDLKKAIERLAPQDMYYEHNERWGDGNGYSHVRAALLGPSLHIPLVDGRMSLGTWQQIVLLDFDNRPRERRVLVHVMGE